jgi:circadian clock protein KaiB
MNIRQHLRLYVAGQSHASRLALSNVRQLCRDHLRNWHSLDIIDLQQRPQLARLDRVIIIPTLVRWFPGPSIKVTGNLSDPERLLKSLVEDPESNASGWQMHSVLKYLLLGGMHKTGADMATVQLLQKGTGFLRIDAHVGFQRKFLDHFRYVSQEQSAWGTALASRQRVAVEDVTLSPIFFRREALTAMLDAGARALHCAPLRGRLGDMFGVVTLYYQKPTLPLDSDKYALMQLARNMTRYLEELNSVFPKTTLRIIN